MATRRCEAYRDLHSGMEHLGRLSVVIFCNGRAYYVCEAHLAITKSLYPSCIVSPFIISS